jgi:predicted transcriptional regulator
VVLIPSININRTLELMEIEKTRPITDEEFDSCISQKETSEEQFNEIIERLKKLKNDNPELLQDQTD